MQSPFDNQGGANNYQGGGNNYNNNGMNPFFTGMLQNEGLRQYALNEVQNQIKNRFIQTPSLSDYIFTSRVRSYFDINNKYVLKKLLKIVFPFTKAKEYETTATSESYDTNYGMSSSDHDHHEKRLLSPDLYIPLMSFMTFILMVCLARGIGQEFKPDLIGYYTSNCLFFAILEMLLYKLILLVVRVKTLSLIDLIAFLNYKFVGLCLILMVNFIIGGWITTIVKIYFSISFVYYMYAELKSHAQGMGEVDIGRTSLKSDTIVYFLSGIQFATMWLLVMTTTTTN